MIFFFRSTRNSNLLEIVEHQLPMDENNHDDDDHMKIKLKDIIFSWKCRNCGESECTRRCWSFYSLKPKDKLEQTLKQRHPTNVYDDNKNNFNKTDDDEHQQKLLDHKKVLERNNVILYYK